MEKKWKKWRRNRRNGEEMEWVVEAIPGSQSGK